MTIHADEETLLSLWREADASVKAGNGCPKEITAAQVQAGLLVHVYGTAELALETVHGRDGRSPFFWRVVRGHLRDAVRLKSGLGILDYSPLAGVAVVEVRDV